MDSLKRFFLCPLNGSAIDYFGDPLGPSANAYSHLQSVAAR